ncbi:MAG: FtsQ-type POTRA domain-containing protein [Euzebyaceae bacterium]|nr:FtsQ-type POTRA domain-containing protein [Euzebyaceae bacterium]
MDERIRARRREVRAAGARRRRRIAASIIVLVLLAAAVVAVARSPLFGIGEVRVRGVDDPGAAAEVVATAAVIEGENLLAADLGAAEARVAGLPWVRGVRAARIPPATVELRVDPRVPAAVVRLPGAAWLVDADGFVLAGGARDDLVAIDAPDAVLPGVGDQIADGAVRAALAVHAGLPAPLRDAIDRYDAPSDRGLRFHLRPPGAGGAAGGVWVRFGAAERIDAKARVLAALIAAAAAQPQPIAEFDVRVPDNPVLLPG